MNGIADIAIITFFAGIASMSAIAGIAFVALHRNHLVAGELSETDRSIPAPCEDALIGSDKRDSQLDSHGNELRVVGREIVFNGNLEDLVAIRF